MAPRRDCAARKRFADANFPNEARGLADSKAVRGIVFSLFEGYVIAQRGHDAYEEVLDAAACGTADPFVGPATYRDDDLLALVDVEARAEGVSRDAVLRALGEYAFPRLAARYAEPLAAIHDFPALLAQLPRVPRLAGDLELELGGPHVRIAYRAPRRLCALAEGLLHSGARHYGARLSLEQRACIDRGAPRCVWEGVVQ